MNGTREWPSNWLLLGGLLIVVKLYFIYQDLTTENLTANLIKILNYKKLKTIVIV